MSITSGSTLLDVPSVTNAVEHLQDLALRMQGAEYGFAEEDVITIDNIIEAISELQSEGQKIHEKLETETIKSSVLRHTLQFLPGLIKAEIQGAVNSARQSNADELTKLQDKLQNINDNIIFLKNKHEELETENSVLHPERDGVREMHEDIITQLNQRMAEKASRQIILNETRDKLRDTNHKIVDLEEGIIQLKEDLIQERADARMEKKRLKKAVYDTTMKTREQKEINVVKKKELDGLLEEVFETETQLDEIRKSIKTYEMSKTRQEAQEQMLIKRLARETQTNEDLRQKGVELDTALENQEQTFSNLKDELDNRVKELKKEIKQQEKSKKKGSKQKKDLEKVLVEKTKIRREDEEIVKEQNLNLQEAKQDLALKAEDAARLRQDNMDMENRIQELGETHQAIVATFQKQIEEMRTQLAKERKERMGLQGQRDAVQSEVDNFKLDTQKYMTKKNKQINEGKLEHDKLTREGTQLQKQIREDETNIRHLQDNLNTSKTDLELFRVKREGEVKMLEDEISSMEVKLKETEDIILEKTPSFVDLETYYEQRTLDYDKMKKNLVALKNKKLGLEDSVKFAMRDVDKLVIPTEKFREDLKEKRQESMEQLKHQAVDRTEVEKLIYTTGSKLRTALEENDHFMQENKKYEDTIESLDTETIDTEQMITQLKAQLDVLKERLSAEWEKDDEIQEIFAARDQSLVDELDELLSKTGTREGIIGDITLRLDSELAVLGQFLDNVAKRRPKESAKMSKSAASKSSRSSQIHSATPFTPSVGSPNVKDVQPVFNNNVAKDTVVSSETPRDPTAIATPSKLRLDVSSARGTSPPVTSRHAFSPRPPSSPKSASSTARK